MPRLVAGRKAGRLCRRVRLALTLLLAAAAPAAAQERLPIFDAHVHYNAAAWQAFPPDEILAKLAAAGVMAALVSSTPDDGTLTLRAAGGARVVPELRPYRTPADMADWHGRADVAEYVEARLATAPYQGIGEVHLADAASADTPQVRRLAALAAARNLVLHVHSGADPVRALLEAEPAPALALLWAHAGMSEPADVVGDMLDRFPRLFAEVSFRAHDIAPGGRLDAEWGALLRRHAGRFLVGTDTYATGRWQAYESLVDEHRAWLAQLPQEAARAIAYGNAVRLFAVEIAPTAPAD